MNTHSTGFLLAIAFAGTQFAVDATAGTQQPQQLREITAMHHRFVDAIRDDPVTVMRFGDAVRFTAGANAPHTVTSGAGSAMPNAGALFQATLQTGDTMVFAPTMPGVYRYFCVEHEVHGMTGTLVVNPIGPQHVVHAHHHRFFDGGNGSSDVFVPFGETVRFRANHNAPHTIASGSGAADPQAGALFDTLLANTGDSFDWTPPAPGRYEFFCREHEHHGMRGVLHVVPDRVRPGTPDDLRMDIGIGQPADAMTDDVLAVQPFDIMQLEVVSPNRTLPPGLLMIGFEAYGGSVPTAPTLPGLFLGGNAVLVFDIGGVPLVLPRAGMQLGFALPPLPVGASLLLQVGVLSPAAANGLWATAHAAQLRY